MPYNGNYRTRLKEIAKSMGHSLNEISYDIDKNKGYLSDVIRGKQNLSVDELEEICKELNIEPRDFFETDYNSEVYLELTFEARKCDEDTLRHFVGLLKRMGGTSPGR